MNDIDAILAELRKFNQERDWDQFHNGKDLAIGLSIEASELLEPFLWKDPKDVNPEKIRENLEARRKHREKILDIELRQMCSFYDLWLKNIQGAK